MQAVLGFEFFDWTDFKENEFLENYIRNGIQNCTKSTLSVCGKNMFFDDTTCDDLLQYAKALLHKIYD